MLRLPRYNVMVPGGFVYTQPETGMKFGGNEAWRAQLRLIQSHRKGNGLTRTKLEEIADDLEAFTCGRFPRLCSANGSNRSGVNTQARIGATRTGCGGCGARRVKK